MKFLKFIPCLLVLLILESCSSSDDSTPPPAIEDSFTYVYDGNAINLTTLSAEQKDNSLMVRGIAANGQTILFIFNKFGNLGFVNSYSLKLMFFPNRYCYANYRSHYFTFNLISIDETNKRVHATFSGNLYEDRQNLNSDSVTVRGEFNLPITEFSPSTWVDEAYCKIGGTDWHLSSSEKLIGNSKNDFILQLSSDDINCINLGFDGTNNGPGTYNFTSSSLTSFVKLAKFNPLTLDFTVYDCVGTMTVTSKMDDGTSFLGFYMEGTFSFTATNPLNPFDVVQISNGRFKTHYFVF